MRVLLQGVLAKPGDSRCIMAHEVPEYFALLIKTEEPGKISHPRAVLYCASKVYVSTGHQSGRERGIELDLQSSGAESKNLISVPRPVRASPAVAPLSHNFLNSLPTGRRSSFQSPKGKRHADEFFRV